MTLSPKDVEDIKDQLQVIVGISELSKDKGMKPAIRAAFTIEAILKQR